jgi:ferritin-like metal-binding protein YciE
MTSNANRPQGSHSIGWFCLNPTTLRIFPHPVLTERPYPMRHLNSLKDLLIEQLREAFDAESQLAEALPSISSAAKSADLREALDEETTENCGRLARLHEAFGLMGIKATRRQSRSMESLLLEAKAIITANGDSRVIDAAIIAAGQRINHHMIASYGISKAIAHSDERPPVVALLDESADQAAKADKRLTKIAEGGFFGTSVNKEAAKA